MANTLYARLYRVNTLLNAIEECWPTRKPVDSKVKPLEFTFTPAKIAAKHVKSIKEHGERLAAGLPGWQVSVDIYAFTGSDAGCVINVYFNGSSAGRCGCSVYNKDIGIGSTSFVPSVQECVKRWPGEVDRLLKKFSEFPAEEFQSESYKAPCEERKRLNKEWHRTMPAQAVYPYGEHKPGWPVG